jgi:hypothetical protein
VTDRWGGEALPMGDLEAALAETKAAEHGPPCSVATLCDRLDPDDRRALLVAMESVEVTARQIVVALSSVGESVEHYKINRHRAGDCKCREKASRPQREWDGLTGRRDG